MDNLSWLDYLIFVAFIAISLGIGVYHSLTGGRQSTTTEFILANRSLKFLPTAVSLFVTFQSAISILGSPAEMYSYGPQFMIMSLVGDTISLLLTIQVAIPWLYPMKLVSVNEYIERRFQSKAVRMIAAVMSILAQVMFMGTLMYAPSAALESATGLPITVSIPVMGAVSVVYTALGGMKAVIWTDVFQGFIIFGGLLAIFIKGLVVVGGFGNVLTLCSESDRLNWADFSPDPTVRHTVWGFIFGHSVYSFGIYGLSQLAVQRYSATKSQSQAILSAALNIPACWVYTLLLGFTGLIIVSYYDAIGCDPLANREISSANQLVTHFVLKIFADVPGFAGIFLATLYGGALSSVSSSLSGSATNFWEDILQWKLMHWTESRKVLLNRLLVVLAGIISTGLAFLASAAPGPMIQISVSLVGVVRGPLSGLVLLGGLTRYANWKGALIGVIISLVGSMWMTIGSLMLTRKHPTLPPLSTDRCVAPNNFTFSIYDDANVSSIFSFADETLNDTAFENSRTRQIGTSEVTLQGLDKFYSISYLWRDLLWILVTIFVGTAASFLFRHESEEGTVDDELLINFRECFRCKFGSKSDKRIETSAVSCINVEMKRENDGEIKGLLAQPFLNSEGKRDIRRFAKEHLLHPIHGNEEESEDGKEKRMSNLRNKQTSQLLA